MAEPLKNMYDPQFFERLCQVIKGIIPKFDEREFINRIFDRNWPDLELKQRTRKITLALHSILPAEFPAAADRIVAISNALKGNGQKLQSYPYIFLPDYIELYGQKNFEISMKAMLEVTQLVSAEFAIRPFLINEQDRTLTEMVKWSKHDNESVRRLSSEGCRPRLPWAKVLPSFIQNPLPILTILEKLKEDPSEYVRRSVANNLNDIAKDNPDVVLKTVRGWKTDNLFTRWIVKHGCRTLMKKGNEMALRLNGFKTKKKFELTGLKSDRKVRKGEYLHFSFSLHNLERKTERIRLEYGIGYQTGKAKISRKVFKIGEFMADPGVPIAISRKLSFKDLTTRKHYEGVHELWIQVNGQKLKEAKFFVQGSF